VQTSAPPKQSANHQFRMAVLTRCIISTKTASPARRSTGMTEMEHAQKSGDRGGEENGDPHVPAP